VKNSIPQKPSNNIYIPYLINYLLTWSSSSYFLNSASSHALLLQAKTLFQCLILQKIMSHDISYNDVME